MADPRATLDQRPDHLTWRHRVLVAAIAVAFVAVGARLWQVQVIDHELYVDQAAITRYGAFEIVAPRGPILDATGYPLATSVDTWDVYLDSYLWRDHGAAREAADAVAAALGFDHAQVFASGTSQQQGDVLLVRHLPYDSGVELLELELWGVRLLPSSIRAYPEDDLAGQLIGFAGLDNEGLWGIEADFDHILRGRAGVTSGERDALGRPIALAPRIERAPAAGGEVQLTIDRFIQAIAEQRLDEALAQYDALTGSIVVMDPRTGAILALASRPSVRLTAVPLDGDELAELVRNRAVTDLYEPGSVFKTLTTAAAIDMGTITPQTTYVDEGRVEIGTYVIKNWDRTAYGEVTMTEFLQRSLNTGAVWIAQQVGADAFYRYVTAFGIGEATHVGLSGEAEGVLRTPDDDAWSPVDLATNAYGQGLAATPLQVLTAVNVFASDGVLMRPYIVSRIVTRDSVRTFEPVEVRRVVSAQTARTVARMMLDVVDGVPWHGARLDGYRVAGKTGTTLVSIPTGYDLDTTIASFAGFLPYEDPAVSVLVKIDQPRGELNLGGQVAAPVFARVASDIMEYLNVPQQRVTSP